MPRYRLLLEYDGGPFQGWQRQATGPSVQSTLEAALSVLDPAVPEVMAAGRTDAGVHALGQVAHVDLARDMPAGRLMAALNALLRPAPIAVLAAAEVDPAFHARFDAVRRHYLYRILQRPGPPALAAGQVWHIPFPLRVELMHAAAQVLIGQHDFTSFRATDCQAKSPLKTLDLVHVRERGGVVEIAMSARSFLHHQVRNIVGTLVLVGRGKLEIAAMASILAARDRRAAGPTAPAAGLFLRAVDYGHRIGTEQIATPSFNA